jgi:DNA-binding XRE family transcriptional regulator
MADQQTHRLSAEEKARYAELARQIEAEFPPGAARPHPDNASRPATLGEYFDLRRLGQELRHLRESQGLSLTDVQERTGVDHTALERLETASDDNPTLNVLARYARALGRRLALTLEEPA